MTSRVIFVSLLAGLLWVACSPMLVDPELTLTADPRTIDAKGQVSTITVTATDDKGKPGSGSVTITTPAGSLKDGATLSLANGTGSVEFSCDAALDSACKGSIRVSGKWNAAIAAVTVSVTPIMGAGGGTASGGGSAAGGGSADAGSNDGGRNDGGVDAGGGNAGGGSAGGGSAGGGTASNADAGITLVASRTTIFRGVGDSSLLTASVTKNGMPAPNEPVSFSTSLGLLAPNDGGMGNMMLVETSNASGQAFARLTENAAGTANVTASALGKSAMTSITISTVQSITHKDTLCGANACTLMGIKGSGFNESARVRFEVKDSSARPVSGVRVTFSIPNPLMGTSVSMDDTTDAMGFATATVQSGPTVGTFTVKAVVIAGQLEATSATIGIRGAKPSNYGFTLQCAKVNLAAYVSPTPPLAISNACTVTLIDRYGNPVGKSEPISLKSEAGAVPSSITSVAFMPGGANTDEGKATFTFNTVGPFPAQDVSALSSVPTQYPFAQIAEPTRVSGALTLSPRDGLVSVLAYVRGEEHFFDDNNNGIRDNNERFIDQGEAFLDNNDNNVWDPGEFYVDDNPNDNVWTPPNGQWDGNSTIWTVIHLLYTGASDSSISVFSPPSFNVPKGTSSGHSISMPDARYNRLESGAGQILRFMGTKGSATLGTGNLALDGYGFELRSRELLNAAGTGPCNAQAPICSYKTLFGDWGRGLFNAVTISGAAATDMMPAAGAAVTIETTVRGNTVGYGMNGTIQ